MQRLLQLVELLGQARVELQQARATFVEAQRLELHDQQFGRGEVLVWRAEFFGVGRPEQQRVRLVHRGGALGRRVEGADRLQGIVEQFEPDRRFGSHRKHVDDVAANADFAGGEHQRYRPHAGLFGPAQQFGAQQLLAGLEVVATAADAARGRGRLQQRF